MYDIASYLGSLPLKESTQGLGSRFSNAGFDFQSFILNSSDITFIFLLTLLNFAIFKFLATLFRNWKKGKSYFEEKVSLFQAGNFIGLF